ncbi:UNVERIFIED_CONTAM: zinc finger protein [Trichonephila clavipes]
MYYKFFTKESNSKPIYYFLRLNIFNFNNCLSLLLGTSYAACSMCNKWFSSGSTLNKHKVWHHKNLFPPFKYSCKHCPYETDNKTNFKNHFEVHSHDRQFRCPTCGNGFKCLASLNNHMIIHTGETHLF